MSMRMFATSLARGATPLLRAPVVAPSVVVSTKTIAVREFQNTTSRRILWKNDDINDKHINGFTLNGIIKNWSVIPMVVICAGASLGVIIFVIYELYSRPDIVLSKNGPMSDKIDLRNPPHLKLRDAYGGDRSLPDLAEIYREMDYAEKEQRAKKN